MLLFLNKVFYTSEEVVLIVEFKMITEARLKRPTTDCSFNKYIAVQSTRFLL